MDRERKRERERERSAHTLRRGMSSNIHVDAGQYFVSAHYFYSKITSYDFPGGLTTLLETSELMCPGAAGRPLGIVAGGKKFKIENSTLVT